MRIALIQAGFSVECEFPIAGFFRGNIVGSFRADLVVNGVLLLELKAVDMLQKCHEAQVYNYLRATQLEVGLLLNFGKSGKVRRFILDNERKPFTGECGLSTELKGDASQNPEMQR